MPIEQFVVLAALALLVTPLAVSYIPRARQSRVFDYLLWLATPLLAFLGAWFALGYLSQYKQLDFLNDLMISDESVMTALVGAVVGGFGLNISLWVLDRFARPPINDDESPDEETAEVTENAETEEVKS